MIGVLGAGAFGTALAISVAQTGRAVFLVAQDAAKATEMTKLRCNSVYLPEARFPDTLHVSATSDALAECEIVLLAVPMQSLRAALSEWHLPKAPLVACCKGIELTSGLGPTEIIAEIRPEHTPALLTGPSFAQDIASGRPTALTLACADRSVGQDLQDKLTTQTLRLYRTTDIVGAALGGALKNVMAIGCGAVIGAGLGDSARAALMTRGFAEMQRVGVALGARSETLMGLSGLGDLALTCTSDQSRNYRLGLSLGRGEPFDANVTVEGAATARAMRNLASQRKIDVPITCTVTDLLDARITIADAIARLMARPLKEE